MNLTSLVSSGLTPDIWVGTRPSPTPKAVPEAAASSSSVVPTPIRPPEGWRGQAGLYGADGQIFSPAAGGVDVAAASLTALSESKREDASSLTIHTADGDSVTITLVQNQWERNEASAQLLSAQAQADGGALTLDAANFEVSREEGSASGYRFKVEGDLNDGELAAIADLTEKIDALAANFFEGRVDDAVAQGQALGFDEGEIADFSLKLVQTETRTERVQYAEQARSVEERGRLPRHLARRVGRHLREAESLGKLSAKWLQRDSLDSLLEFLTHQRGKDRHPGILQRDDSWGAGHMRLLAAARELRGD